MSVPPALLDELLSRESVADRRALVGDAGLLNEQGLSDLLDVAGALEVGQPAKAGAVAALCVELAAQAGAAAVVPRARYLLARMYDLSGEPQRALDEVAAARDGFTSAGQPLASLRADISRMAMLYSTGRVQESMTVGETVLAALDDRTGDRAAHDDVARLRAMALNNVGVALSLSGRYAAALESYAAAAQEFQQLGMHTDLALLRHNTGMELVALGRGTEALSAFHDAAQVCKEAGLALSEGQSLIDLGRTHLLVGQFTAALETFRQARQVLAPLACRDFHLIALHSGQAYLALNLHGEALEELRAAEEGLRRAGMRHYLAEALSGIGSALRRQERWAEAEAVLGEAADLYRAAGNAPLLGAVLVERAALTNDRGQPDAAQQGVREALALLEGTDAPVQQTYAHLLLADLLVADPAAAEVHAEHARRLAEDLGLPQLRYRARQRLGHLRLRAGDADGALPLLRAAAEEIEQLRGTLATDTLRAAFLRDKVDAYADLVTLYLARGDDTSLREAFAVAERAKSRALLDLLTGAVQQQLAVAGDDAYAARLLALERDLTAVYNRLLNDDQDEQGQRRATLHMRAERLEAEISRLRLLSGSPLGADCLGAPMSLEQVRGQLPSDVTLIAYHVLAGEVVAFVEVNGRLRVARSLTTVDEVSGLVDRLGAQWNRFRAGDGFARQHGQRLRASTQRLLRRLHGLLWEPIAPWVAGERVAVVPHGPLHQVPFHALHDGRAHLIQRHEFTYAPSATVLGLCQGRAPRGGGRAAVLGVPDRRIPEVRREVRAVADHLPGADVRVGPMATAEALIQAAAVSDTLHLACHGLFRPDNPMFSALKLSDGWLLATQAAQLDLGGALVTLSACESGRGRVTGDGDEVVGLTRAFLGAGASAVAVSLWLVHDATTAVLMRDWYRRMAAGQDVAAALRSAQLALATDYPHPYYWAPFVLVGGARPPAGTRRNRKEAA